MDANVIQAIGDFGSAGAVIIVVFYFLNFIKKRDEDWQKFFVTMNQQDNKVLADLETTMQAVKDELVCLRSDFNAHDQLEREFLRRIDGNGSKS